MIREAIRNFLGIPAVEYEVTNVEMLEHDENGEVIARHVLDSDGQWRNLDG